VISVKPVKRPVGTRIEITFGPDLPCDKDTLDWAHKACKLAQYGSAYTGKTSAWWYDAAQFHELLDAAGNRPVRDLVAQLDGCSGGKAGDIVDAAGLSRAICKDVTRQQATKLLKVAQQYAKAVSPKRLGAIGPGAFYYHTAYHCEHGIGKLNAIADLPFVVEAWAEALDEIDDSLLSVYVNRTPVTGNFDAGRDGKDIDFHGGGLHHTVAETTKKAQFDIHLNIITPFMPITSDGKEPNLVPFFNAIETAVGKVVRKAHRPKHAAKIRRRASSSTTSMM
jgi:hypothetical protein